MQGVNIPIFSYNGAFEDFELQLPHDETPPETEIVDGPKFISTLNSDRISTVLANQGIGMTNLSVIDLKPNLDAWPRDFLGNTHPNVNGRISSLHHHFQHDVPFLLQNQTLTSLESNGLRLEKELQEHVSNEALPLRFVQRPGTQTNSLTTFLPISVQTQSCSYLAPVLLQKHLLLN